MGRGRAALLVLVALLPLGGCAGAVEAAAPAGPGVQVAPARPAPPTPQASRQPRATAAPEPVPTAGTELRPAAKHRPDPVRFGAAAVGIDLPVEPYGVDDGGLMQLPETVNEVAWYRFSPRPGDGVGSTVLAAHVDTRADGLGPFARLTELDTGDELTVTDAGDRTRRYLVTDVEKVDKGEVEVDRLFRRDGEPELKVITCGGSFDRGSGYSDNVIVTARPA